MYRRKLVSASRRTSQICCTVWTTCRWTGSDVILRGVVSSLCTVTGMMKLSVLSYNCCAHVLLIHIPLYAVSSPGLWKWRHFIQFFFSWIAIILLTWSICQLNYNTVRPVEINEPCSTYPWTVSKTSAQACVFYSTHSHCLVTQWSFFACITVPLNTACHRAADISIHPYQPACRRLWVTKI